jgi:hypothetical protein
MKEQRFMTAGEFARQIKKPYTTVATWLRKGQVPGAVPQTIGDFRIWMVPHSAVETFEEWQPKPGRPKKEVGPKKAAKKAKKGGTK